MAQNDNDAPLLLDASRLVWRRWTGTRQTGIDRICLAWMEHYGPRAQAVIVHRHGQTILPYQTSQALFRLLAEPAPEIELKRRKGGEVWFRTALAALAIRRAGHLRDQLCGRRRFWLNAGHTGLDAPGLTDWVQRRNLRPVYLIHDLIPITHPQFCRVGEEDRHRRRMRTALDTASGIVTNSSHTLEVLNDFAASEACMMPPAIAAWPGAHALVDALPSHDGEPTFVALGTIEGRKNHALLLTLWRQLINAGNQEAVPRLVIVGRRGWEADRVFAQLNSGDFGDRIVEIGPLDDQRLKKVLGGARALLFPSLAEGYGLPLIEALAAGVPVIASDLPVFREIGQGIPELLPVDDLAVWGSAVSEYTRDPSPRRTEQLHRLESFQAPGWQEHFSKVDALLTALC
jgi:glycosyltransferase involved in cell wall biosynthesis